MTEVVLLAAPGALAARVAAGLRESDPSLQLEVLEPAQLALGTASLPAAAAAASVIYVPTPGSQRQAGPSLTEADSVLQLLLASGARQLVLVSSAELYGATPRNPGFLDESRANGARAQRAAISAAWHDLEALAQRLVSERVGEGGEQSAVTLTILRTCPTPVRGGTDYFSKLLLGGISVTLAGHDPSIQILSPHDLAHALSCALTRKLSGAFNIAPDGVMPIKAALELAHALRVSLPRELQLHARRLLSALGLAEPVERLDYIRYSWTVSNRKAKAELGFEPTRSSLDALLEFLGDAAMPQLRGEHEHAASYDDFGMDKDFVAARSAGLFDFLARHYWRIEVEGIEHIPKTGKGILAGMHRGLVAWDGVMIMHLLSQRMHRYPRFLVHPTGFQFPFVFDFTTKLGGVMACQENADYVLDHGELLGIFPEGIRGVFSLYREAYELRKFGRHDFVKIALRHGAPIVPFVITGSAESYPIVGKVDWAWWTRKTEWPYFPITPTLFPLMPAPLPAKWRIRFLPPTEVAQYGPDAARDAVLVRKLSDGIRDQMEVAIAQATAARTSIFF